MTQIRKSTEQDKEAINNLFMTCYGYDWNLISPLTNLDDRYYLMFMDALLVAMTGLGYSDEYKAMEVDWTCTHPDHRHRGYMSTLFSVMLQDVNEIVYCSCWRLPSKDKPNLRSIMDLYGFKKVINGRLHWQSPHNCHCADKCSFSTGTSCDCFEDLYMRDPSNAGFPARKQNGQS